MRASWLHTRVSCIGPAFRAWRVSYGTRNIETPWRYHEQYVLLTIWRSHLTQWFLFAYLRNPESPITHCGVVSARYKKLKSREWPQTNLNHVLNNKEWSREWTQHDGTPHIPCFTAVASSYIFLQDSPLLLPPFIIVQHGVFAIIHRNPCYPRPGINTVCILIILFLYCLVKV